MLGLLCPLIGGAVILYFVVNAIYFVYLRLFYKSRYFENFAGNWALISGSSYGTGEALARSLAKRRINVVLMARSKQKLQALAKEIEETYNVRTEIIALDAFDEASNLATLISSALTNINISILINNLGGIPDTIGYSAKKNLYKYFHEYNEQDYKLHRQMNIDLTYILCRICLPSMIASKQGAIINIGSLASIFSTYLSIYAPEKAKLNMFTKALYNEYSKFNIDVGCALGGRISSPSFYNNNHPLETKALDSCRTDHFAEDTLNLFRAPFVGPIYVPNWLHCIQLHIVSYLPSSIAQKIFEEIKHRHDEPSWKS